MLMLSCCVIWAGSGAAWCFVIHSGVYRVDIILAYRTCREKGEAVAVQPAGYRCNIALVRGPYDLLLLSYM
jgi:hypothetical protein